MRFITVLLLALLVPTAWAGSEVESLMRRGRVSEALPLARAEAVAAPDDLDAQERLIDLLFSVGLAPEADRIYRARVAARDDADSWYLLGRAVLAAEDARAAYDTAISKQRDHARAYMGLGAVFRGTGRFQEAEMAYLAALDLNPKLSEAWAGLGAAQLAQGKVAEAVAAARGGVANVPDEADSYLALSVLVPEEAMAALKEAAKRVPDDARVHAAVAEEYLKVGDGANAKVAAEAALRIDPNRGDAQLSLVFADSMASGALDAAGYQGLIDARGAEEEDMTTALAAYDRLIAAHPRSSLPLMGRARVRATMGDRDAAIADLGAALALDPSNVEAMAASGLLLLEAGRASEAKPRLQRASAERPLDVSLTMAYARAQKESGDLDGAVATLARAEAVSPYDARLVLTRAKWLAESKRSSAAYDALREGVKRMPGDDRLVLSLAAAAKDLGRPEEAADLLEVLAERSGSEQLRDLARRLRAGDL